jgi:hypothetical protein
MSRDTCQRCPETSQRAGEGTRTPNHLFTRSGPDVQGRASTPVAWRNGAEKVPDVWLRCCHGCCQPRHGRCRLLASQLAKDVRSHAALAPASIATSLPERLPRPHLGLVHRLYRVRAPPNTGYGHGTGNSPLRSSPLRAPLSGRTADGSYGRFLYTAAGRDEGKQDSKSAQRMPRSTGLLCR